MYLTDGGALILLVGAVLVVWLLIIFQSKTYQLEERGQITESADKHEGDEQAYPKDTDS